MNSTAMLIAAFVVLPAVFLAIWAWFTMVQLEDDLRSLTGFEALHFDIGRQAAANFESGAT